MPFVPSAETNAYKHNNSGDEFAGADLMAPPFAHGLSFRPSSAVADTRGERWETRHEKHQHAARQREQAGWVQ